MMDIRMLMLSTHQARLFSTRVTIAMSGLVLWTSLMLVVLTYRNVERSILAVELVAVVGAVVLAVALARLVTRPLVHMAGAGGLRDPGHLA
jgi:hypothetical protein